MAIDPIIGQGVIAAGQAGVQAVTRGGPRRQKKWNSRLMREQNELNRENQQWLLEQNKQLQEEQRAYDSPKAQMQRYIEAGLNPMLIYGSGSGSAGSAFPIDAGSLPGAQQAPVDASYPDVAGSFMSSMQAQAQIGLTQAKTGESYMKQQAIEISNDIAKTNPMLDPMVYQETINALTQTARVKGSEMQAWSHGEGNESRIHQKVRQEVELMSQKIGLNTTDLSIKNKILESKEFENVVKELQARWLKDSEVTPEHIRQGLMLILGKMLGR